MPQGWAPCLFREKLRIRCVAVGNSASYLEDQICILVETLLRVLAIQGYSK